MSEPNDTVGDRYRSARTRLTDLLGAIEPAAWHRPVAACPGWTVHDVLAHLVGIIEDASAGRLKGPPPPAATRSQVERHRADEPDALLTAWVTMAPGFEDALTTLGRWPAFLDVLSHEHDVRTALGDSSCRDHTDVILAANLLTAAPPEGLRFDLDGGARGHAGADAVATLAASPFEVLRLRLGRRSRTQVLAMAWTGDPQPFLDDLFIFGPATDDLTE